MEWYYNAHRYYILVGKTFHEIIGCCTKPSLASQTLFPVLVGMAGSAAGKKGLVSLIWAIVCYKGLPISRTGPDWTGRIFFWTRFHNLVVFNGENCACANGIAKQRYIRGNSFATEDLGILEYSSMLIRGGSTGSWTGCNLKTGAWLARCCMIAFLSCLTFTLPILRPCLSLPTVVPQGYSTLFVSILSGESKELITLMKAWGYSGEKASGMISIRLV